MGATITQELAAVERLLDGELGPKAVAQILERLGAPGFPAHLLPEARLYNEYLPKAGEIGITARTRALHLLWDVFDKLPLSVVTDFAIPYRRLVAERLFKRCGRDFIADEGVRFNFGQLLEVGDDVFLNRGVFLDTKGGVTIGDATAFAEWVAVFSHGHSEADHVVRTYAPVAIGPYVKVYAGATILPGVTVGEEAIIAARALVNRDVAPGMVVAGIPAKPVRERASEGRHGEALDHVWLAEAAFQRSRRRDARGSA